MSLLDRDLYLMKKNLLWNTIGTFLYTFAQWVLTVLVVRMDSYEFAGYLAIAITASSTYPIDSIISGSPISCVVS